MKKVFDPNCQKCFGEGGYHFGGSFGGPTHKKECDCWVKGYQERAAAIAREIQKEIPNVLLDEWKTAAIERQTALEEANDRIKELEAQIDKHEDQCMSWSTLLMEARDERDHWKANHDNAVEIKRAVLDRPDLQDRAARVLQLIEERDGWRSFFEIAEAEYRCSTDVIEQEHLRRRVDRLTERLNEFLTGDDNQVHVMQLAAQARQIADLSDEVFVLARAQTDSMFVLRMARRIWRDLKHCIGDIPKDKHEFREMYQAGLNFYAQFLGRTEDYRNHFDMVIRGRDYEIETLKKRIAELEAKG